MACERFAARCADRTERTGGPRASAEPGEMVLYLFVEFSDNYAASRWMGAHVAPKYLRDRVGRRKSGHADVLDCRRQR